MFSKFEFLIAFRYLKSKRKEGFISITAIFSLFGITIGVATLIIVMSVMNGFRYELVNRILGINSHISIYHNSGHIYNYQEIIDKIKEIPEVANSNPIIETQAMVVGVKEGNDQNVGALIKAIKSEDLVHKNLINENILAGDINVINDKDQIIIGSGIARNLNLQIGDYIKIISSSTAQTLMGAIPRIKSYKVGAVFESGMYEYDNSTIFTNFDIGQVHFNQQNSISNIEIFAKNIDDLPMVKNKILNHLKLKEDYHLIDWQQSNAGFIDALKVESTVMFLILTLIILVAAFNIISTMIMLVNDKNKNIALLRAMGCSKYSITRIFLISGFTIGFIGTFCGAILGIGFASNINSIKLWLESFGNSQLFNPAIYFLSTLPSKIFIKDLVIIILMSLTISFLATIYPAYKASRAKPAEILRYE